MGEPAGYAELREAFFGPTGQPGRRPARPDALRRHPRRVPDARRAAPAQRLPPALAELLHAAAARDVRRRRAARPGDPAGRRRLARRAARDVRRGGGRPLAVRPRRLRAGQLRAADLRRRHGELPRRWRSSATCASPAIRGPGEARPVARPARRRPDLHVRPDPLLDRAGRSTSWASRPTRSSSCRPTTDSASTRSRFAEAIAP